jgi:hypothetical protein
MTNKKRQDRIIEHGGETYTECTSNELEIEQLRRGFEAFRREHRPGTRIPQVLRDKALAALSGGTPKLKVLRACRISPQQLRWWRQGQSCGAQGLELREHEARIFPVVDDVPAIAVERAGEHQAQELELRIGRWAISLRQLV